MGCPPGGGEEPGHGKPENLGGGERSDRSEAVWLFYLSQDLCMLSIIRGSFVVVVVVVVELIVQLE